MSATYRQQADAIKLVGQEKAAHIVNLKRGKRELEAKLVEARLPILRDAYASLDNLAKEAGE